MVAALSWRKSTQKRRLPSFFSYHHHWRGPWAVRAVDDIAGQHLLHLRHLLSVNCGVLPAIGLAERRPMGLDLMLQQRCIPKIIFSTAEYVAKLAK